MSCRKCTQRVLYLDQAVMVLVQNCESEAKKDGTRTGTGICTKFANYNILKISDTQKTYYCGDKWIVCCSVRKMLDFVSI